MLEFQKPQRGITLDFTGLSEEDAIALVMRTNATAPPHPSTINLGCGPEPDGIDLDAVRPAAGALLSAPSGKPLGDVKVDLADLNGPEDRLAIVVTEPLTTNEEWVAMVPGELKVFVDGVVAGCGCYLTPPPIGAATAETSVAATV